MRVVLLNHTYLPARGGIENYLRYLARELKRLGHDPVVLCKRHEAGLPEREFVEGIEVLRHPAWRANRREALRRPSFLVEKLQAWMAPRLRGADLIVSRYPLYGCAAARLGVPFVGLPPGLYARLARLAGGGWKERLFARLWKGQLREIESESLRGATRVVVFSRNMQEQVRAAYGLKASKIEVLPPGVDTDFFQPRPKDEELLKEFGISAGMPVVLTVARLTPQKNLPLLFRAVGSLEGERPCCVVVGDGPERRRLEALAERLGIREEVRFAGERADVHRFYASADFFVLPSHYEPFGQVLLESMASGLPCIALRNDPPRVRVATEEIVEEDVTGFVVAGGSSGPLAERMRCLLADPARRRKVGRDARKRCERLYRWDRHVQRLVEIAGDVEKNGPPAARSRGGGP